MGASVPMSRNAPPNVPRNRTLVPDELEWEDGFAEDGNWSEWDRRVGPFEPDIARELTNAEVGDTLTIELTETKTVEFLYIDRRPGVVEIRTEYEMTCWVIRGKYVFITARDGEALIMGSWVIDEEKREHWTIDVHEDDE